MEYRFRKTGKYYFVELGEYETLDYESATGESLKLFITSEITFFDSIGLAIRYVEESMRCPMKFKNSHKLSYQVESRISDSYMFENLLGHNVAAKNKSEAISEYKRQLLNRNRNMLTMETMNNWEFLAKEI